MVHGFYAFMGGLAIHVPRDLPDSERFLPIDAPETWFIDHNRICDGLPSEAYRRHLPDISEEEIKSKSKANGFSKALVCIQALWFIFQCLTRRM